LLVPNEDFLRAAEALRLHHFTALEYSPSSSHHLDGLDNYAAQYIYPPEITDRLGHQITIALFPASLVGWKLVYVPVPRPNGSFTTALAVQKVPLPVEAEVEQSFIQLSVSSSTSDIRDTDSVASDDTVSHSDVRYETDDEYVVVAAQSRQPSPVSVPVPISVTAAAPALAPRVLRRDSVPMERGNGPLSPSESVCDIADMKPDPGVGAVEMLPGRMMLERLESQLTELDKGIYVARKDGLKESFENAIEFLRRDGLRSSKFAKLLEIWNSLLSDGSI